MKKVIALTLAFSTLTSAAFAKTVDCTVGANNTVVFNGAVTIEHEAGEPEGSGSGMIYRNGIVRFYVTTYPMQIIGQVLTFNDVVEKTVTANPIGQLVDFVSSNGGRAAELSRNLEEIDYNIICKE